MTYTPRLKVSAGGTNRTSFPTGGAVVYRATVDDVSVGPTLTSDSSLIFRDTGSGGTARLIVGTGAIPALDPVGLEVTTGDAVINGITAGRGVNGLATNTVFGASAGTAMSGAAFANTIVGDSAASAAVTASYCVVVGKNAQAGTTPLSGESVVVGYSAGVSSTTAAANVLVGYAAGADMVVGGNNVCIGWNAQAGTTSSGSNVVIGSLAGASMGVGADNVCIGASAAAGTSSVGQNTIVGAGAGTTIGSGTNNVCIGYNASPTGSGTSNEITLGNSSMTRFRIGTTGASAPNPGFAINTLSTQPTMNVGHDANTSNAPFASFFIAGANSGGIRQAAGGGTPLVYATSSDYRIKTDVQAIETPLDRLTALKPCRFHFTTNPSGPLVEGFIAHEVQAVVPQAVVGTKDEVDADGNAVHQGLDQAHLVPLLTAVCQELHAKNQQLEARLAALEAAFAAKT